MAKHKKRKGVAGRVVAVILCVLLLIVVGCGSSWVTGWQLTGEVNPAKWGKSDREEDEVNDPRYCPAAMTLDGEAMDYGGTYTMSRGFVYLDAVANLEPTIYGGAGITLTPELSNEYINGYFDYTVSFADPSSEWAAGKVATYYVQANPVDDGKSVELKYLAPFGEQIVLTATLRDVGTSDSCTIDCIKLRDHMGVLENEVGLEAYIGEAGYFNVSFELGVGTVIGEIKDCRVSLYLNERYISKVKSYLTFDIDMHSKIYTAEAESFVVTSGNHLGYLAMETETNCTFSDFITDFDSFDKAHQEAIAYAIYRANTAGSIKIDFYADYYFGDYFVAQFSESDMTSSHFYLDYPAGEEIEPNVTLNKNYAF